MPGNKWSKLIVWMVGIAAVAAACSSTPRLDVDDEPLAPTTASTRSGSPDPSADGGQSETVSTSTVPDFPTTTTTTTTTTLPTDDGAEHRPQRGGECIDEPGALQSLIDETPDGVDVSDMKGKLFEASQLGFVVLDLTGLCFDDQGTIRLSGRYGLWIVQADTAGSNWVLDDVQDTVLSGIDLHGGAFTATGGNLRIEGGEFETLTMTGVTDLMMGSMVITGATTFESMRRETPGQGFVRNTTFGTVEILGDIDGFSITSSRATAVTVNTTSERDLRLEIDIVP